METHQVMTITLTCPEGWTYISWQRVLVDFSNRPNNLQQQLFNVYNLAEAFNQCPGDDDMAKVFVGVALDNDNKLVECLFVLSGESYGMEDFAEDVARVVDFDCNVVCKDANE